MDKYNFSRVGVRSAKSEKSSDKYKFSKKSDSNIASEALKVMKKESVTKLVRISKSVKNNAE